MRVLCTVFALVVVCSAAVLAQTPRILTDYGSESKYTPTPAALADPTETPAPVGPYETPAPVAEDVSAPLTEETPAPLAQETPSPYAEETPAPIAEDPSAPQVVEEETYAVVAEETTLEEETPAADSSRYRRALRRRRQIDNITADITTTSTTARPSIATPALPGSNATEESGNATATCAANAVCFHDEDCGSTGDKKGRCLGFFNGKCNCNACLNFLTCKDDSACGGLKGACNATTSRCSCDEGYKANGFAGGLLDAFRELCNVKDCNGENQADACFGLPCNSGRCIC